MAKKSAKSKGYRKASAKKPYLSKRDIALLCVLVAAIAIGAFFLFRYDDGALKVKDGAVVTEGDNWLIVNGSNTRGGRRYFKLGEIGEIEGYDRETGASLSDANLPEYTFTTDSAEAAADTVTVSCSHSGAEALAKYAAASLSGIEGADVGETQSADLNGQAAQYFFYAVAPSEAEEAEGADEEATEAAEAEAEEQVDEADTDADEAPAEGEAEASETVYRKTLCGYLDAGHDSCVILRLERTTDSADAYPTDEAMLAALEEAVKAVTLEETGK